MDPTQSGQAERDIGAQVCETEAGAASLPPRWLASIDKWLSAVEQLVDDPESMLVGW